MGSEIVKAYGAERRDDMLWFAPEKLVVVRDKAHALYDERVEQPLEEAMVLSIMADGVRVPIIVRLNGKTAKGAPIPEVVDGKRRTMHAVEANRRLVASGKEPVRVPAVRARGEAADLYGVMILTNENRKADSPLIKARKLQKFLSMGRGEGEAAIKFGVTQQTIKNLLKILELHPEVQKAIDKGLPTNVAKELSVLPQEEQPAALEKLVASGNTRGARAVEAAKKVRKGEAGVASKVRMMSKHALEEWKKKLKGATGKDAEIAYSVVSRILGAERSLANFPRLRESLEAAEL